MSVEKRANSWALSLVDTLESPANPNVRLGAAAGAAVVTALMWIVHLTYLDIFAVFMELDSWAKLCLGFALAPPFVLAFAVGSFLYRAPVESVKTNEVGPMSTYFYQDRANKRRKLLIGAAIFAALNLVLMFITSVSLQTAH